jgi:multiple sugar transport system permease protein
MRAAGTKPGETRAKLTLLYIVLSVLGVIWLGPILWMVSTSVKSETEIFTLPLHWVPWQPTLENFVTALTKSLVTRWFVNSVIIAFFQTALTLVVTSLAAYSFARIPWKGRGVAFIVVISTMMIPVQVTLIPTYILLSRMGWVNTYVGAFAPGLAAAFGVFLLRQFFQGIPTELEDAALIDGAGRMGIFLRIIIPLSVPALTALGIFSALASWNNFLWPLIVLQDNKKMTLPVGLATVLRGTYSTSNYGVLMAGAFIASAPVLLIYMIFQDRIIKGVTLTGIIKG